MRNYLLGLLPEDRAAALEAEYFVNRAFFLKLQSAETDLITEYLNGDLRSNEKTGFESRYLHVPELRRKLEEVRTQRDAASSREDLWSVERSTPAGSTLAPVSNQPSRWPSSAWSFALASAFALVFGIGFWIYRNQRPVHSETAAATVTPPISTQPNTQLPATAPAGHTVEQSAPAAPAKAKPVFTRRLDSRPEIQQAAKPRQNAPVTSQPEITITDTPSSGAQIVSAFAPRPAPSIFIPAISLSLNPGLTKGADSTPALLTQPPAVSVVHLTLQLPGQTNPIDADITISMVKADGSLELKWKRPGPVASFARKPDMPPLQRLATPVEPSQQQEIVLSLSGTLFQPGDYLVEVSSVDGTVTEKYFYRVIERK